MLKLAVGAVLRATRFDNTIDMLFVLLPLAFVTVRVMVFVPVLVYVTAAGCLTLPLAGDASVPKSHAYVMAVGDVDALASNVTVIPLIMYENRATGRSLAVVVVAYVLRV